MTQGIVEISSPVFKSLLIETEHIAHRDLEAFAGQLMNMKKQVEVKIFCDNLEMFFGPNLKIGKIQGYDCIVVNHWEKKILEVNEKERWTSYQPHKITFRLQSKTTTQKILLTTRNIRVKNEDFMEPYRPKKDIYGRY